MKSENVEFFSTQINVNGCIERGMETQSNEWGRAKIYAVRLPPPPIVPFCPFALPKWLFPVPMAIDHTRQEPGASQKAPLRPCGLIQPVVQLSGTLTSAKRMRYAGGFCIQAFIDLKEVICKAKGKTQDLPRLRWIDGKMRLKYKVYWLVGGYVRAGKPRLRSACSR